MRHGQKFRTSEQSSFKCAIVKQVSTREKGPGWCIAKSHRIVEQTEMSCGLQIERANQEVKQREAEVEKKLAEAKQALEEAAQREAGARRATAELQRLDKQLSARKLDAKELQVGPSSQCAYHSFNCRQIHPWLAHWYLPCCRLPQSSVLPGFWAFHIRMRLS